MSILQDIFKDHYEEIIYTLHPRDSVIENVEKMINCGDPSFGGAMYGCPHCGKLKFVPFRCHSRFCPTCGNLYAMQRTTSMSFKLVNVVHRHCVFTIDENLREFFLNDRTLLDCLFHAVNSVVSRMFLKQNKSMNFTPGFILVLHTFGRDLKWNPLMNVCACIVVIFINKALLEYGGTDGNLAVGAYGIINRTTMFFVMIVFGITQGMQPILGFNYGAGNFERVRKTLRIGIWLGVSITSNKPGENVGMQVRVTFTDPVGSDDYFGVKMVRQEVFQESVGDVVTDVAYRNIVTCDFAFDDEPIFNNKVGLDAALNFDYDYYDYLYIWTDTEIQGRTYTLRMDTSYLTPEEFSYTNWDGKVTTAKVYYRYKIYLYRLTKEFYSFLKSVNDIANNNLGLHGFAPLRGSYTNVSNGFGVVSSVEVK